MVITRNFLPGSSNLAVDTKRLTGRSKMLYNLMLMHLYVYQGDKIMITSNVENDYYL